MQKPEKPAAPPAAGRAGRRVHIITFGCQMNEADSELIAASFLKRGFELTAELKTADAVVVNTCTVRQRAEDKAISQIGRLRKWKDSHPEGKLFVVGCAAEKLGRKIIKNRFPFVDEVVGAKSIDSMDEIVGRMNGETGRQPDCAAIQPSSHPAAKSPSRLAVQPPSPLTVSPPSCPTVSSFVTIMRGCSLKCSYCIVPAVRGPAAFLPAETILEDAAAKLRAGAREIVLLGQTVNAWRRGKTAFAGLLKKVLALPGLERLRFMSPHPLYFDDGFFSLFRDNPKIARHMHLPAQSGSDRILKAMRRGYTRAQYLDLVSKIRKAAPGSAVSTDFIVGYPGESEADFKETLSLVGESGVSFAYCFKYSRRLDEPGLAPDLGESEIEERLERLLAEVKKNSGDILNKRIGRIEEVLLEAEDYGRTSANFVVRLDRKTGLIPGSLVRTKITGVHKNTLKGRLIP